MVIPEMHFLELAVQIRLELGFAFGLNVD